MRAVLGFAGLLILFPVAAAQSGLILGTEELPEVPDATSDVNASPTYTGPTEFIDFTAGWFEYRAETDQIALSIRVAGAERLDEAPPPYRVQCFMDGTLTGGAEERQVSFLWWKDSGANIASRVFWSIGGTEQEIDVVHEFGAELTTPGYFRFSVPRQNLTRLAQQVENPAGACAIGVPASAPLVVAEGSTFSIATDRFASEAAYSFTDLRQSRNAEGEILDPVERFERENATASPSTAMTSQEESTPFVNTLAVLASLGAVVLWRRRNR